MNRPPSRPSRSARRNAETWTERLAGSTNTFGQTRAINSCLVTNSPGRSSRTMSICMARLPRGTGLSPSSRRNCAGSKRNRPNEISRVVALAGLPALSWSASGSRASRSGTRARRRTRSRRSASCCGRGRRPRWSVATAERRNESRGMHRREDFPEPKAQLAVRLLSGGLDRVWVAADGESQSARSFISLLRVCDPPPVCLGSDWRANSAGFR